MLRVSVILPMYNSAKSIHRCVDSILFQTFSDFELIAIDDGSNDDTYKIVEQFCDDRIRLYKQSNQGVARTRNAGIKCALADYIMFVDNDDYLDKDYIEQFVSTADNNSADVVVGGFRRVNNDGSIIYNRLYKQHPWTQFIQMAPWARLYKKQFLQNNNLFFLDHKMGEDVYFNFLASNLSNKTIITEYIGYNWVNNQDSVSNTIQKKISNLADPLPMLQKTLDDVVIPSKISDDLFEFFYIRYIIWYFLFSCKGSSNEVIKDEYKRLFMWLEENFPNYKRNKNISFFYPEGEIFYVRVVIKIFMSLVKLNLADNFLIIYSKL